MKKLLVLAMVLIFAAFPAFAEFKLGGEFDYYMVNGFDKDCASSFEDNLNKLELDFSISVGDYNTMKIELEEDGSWNKGTGTYPEGTPSFNYAKIITNWGKMFGLDGIGIQTTIGIDYFETKNKVNFSGFNYEYSDNFMNPHMDRDIGGKIDLSFLSGLIQPYAAISFDTVQAFDDKKQAPKDEDGVAEWMIGSAFDFKSLNIPLWLEAYYVATGAKEDTYYYGLDAMYTLTVDKFNFKFGGYIEGLGNKPFAKKNGTAKVTAVDNKDFIYGAAVAISGYNATITGSIAGLWGDTADDLDVNMGVAVFGVDASYFFLDWFGINAGMGFAFGDYKTDLAGDKAVQSFEVGAIVKPSKGVEYRLGYMYIDEDVSAANGYFLRTLNTSIPTHGKTVTGDKGGLYFTTKIDF